MGLLERWFAGLLRWAIQLASALVGGLLAAPLVGLQRARAVVTVRRAAAHEVIDVRHEVLRNGRPRADAVFDGDSDLTTRHWVAMQADRAVGVVTVVARTSPEGPAWQLRGMAVLPGLQGTGVGAAMLSAVHAEVAEPMWCNAREGAVPFYERAGWTLCSATFEIPGVGPHRRMVWRG